MKKMAFILLIMVLTLSIIVPMAIPAMAALGNMSVVSDTSVKIIGVYNLAGGPNNYVNLSATPLNAVIAAEPKPYPTVYTIGVLDSDWDNGTGLYFQNTNPGADWIWETVLAEDPATVYPSGDPLYDPDASSNGRVVVFEKSFFIPGTPTAATLNIAADNCYEIWINGVYVNRSATAKVAGWETTNLDENSVGSTGWQTVGNYLNLEPFLIANDTNTIKILAGNEYYSPTAPGEFNNSPNPPYVADPFRQQNPGALIFKMDIEYDTDITPPVPELPAIVLLCLGLVGLGGFILIKRRSTRLNAR